MPISSCRRRRRWNTTTPIIPMATAIQCGYAAIPPVGQGRSNWRVACDLAHAMGIDDDFYDCSEQDLVEALAASTTKWPLPVDQQRLSQGLPTPLPMPDDYQTRFAGRGKSRYTTRP